MHQICSDISDLDVWSFSASYTLQFAVFSTGLKIKMVAKGNRFSSSSRWIPDLVPLLMETAGLAAEIQTFVNVRGCSNMGCW